MLERYYVDTNEKPLQSMTVIELAAFYEKHYRQNPLQKLYHSIMECDIPYTTGIPAAIILEAVVKHNVRTVIGC